MPSESRIFRILDPANNWDWNEIFLNKIAYAIDVLVWQNGYDPKNKAQHEANMPKLFVPEFIKINQKKNTNAKPVEDIKDILSKPRK